MTHPAEIFLAEIEQFLEKTGLSATKLGKVALGDPSFVGDLRRGRMPSLRLVDRMNRFMAEYGQDTSSKHEESAA